MWRLTSCRDVVDVDPARTDLIGADGTGVLRLVPVRLRPVVARGLEKVQTTSSIWRARLWIPYLAVPVGPRSAVPAVPGRDLAGADADVSGRSAWRRRKPLNESADHRRLIFVSPCSCWLPACRSPSGWVPWRSPSWWSSTAGTACTSCPRRCLRGCRTSPWCRCRCSSSWARRWPAPRPRGSRPLRQHGRVRRDRPGREARTDVYPQRRRRWSGRCRHQPCGRRALLARHRTHRPSSVATVARTTSQGGRRHWRGIGCRSPCRRPNRTAGRLPPVLLPPRARTSRFAGARARGPEHRGRLRSVTATRAA